MADVQVKRRWFKKVNLGGSSPIRPRDSELFPGTMWPDCKPKSLDPVSSIPPHLHSAQLHKITSTFILRWTLDLYQRQREETVMWRLLRHLFYFCFCFSGLHLWYMEVPRLGVELELQLPAYATATATQDPSLVCHLHCRSRQSWILNPLSEASGLLRLCPHGY